MENKLALISNIAFNPEYSHISKKPETLKKLIAMGYIETEQIMNKQYIVVQSLEKYFEFENDIEENYIPLRVFCSTLRISKERIFDFFKKLPDSHMYEVRKLESAITIAKYRKITEFIKKSVLQHFNETYIERNEAMELLNVSLANLNNLTEQLNILKYNVGEKPIYFVREQILNIINAKIVGVNEEDYYSAKEARERLQLSASQFSAFRKEIDWRSVKVGSERHCYEKEIVNRYKEVQSRYKDKYYTLSQILDLLGLKSSNETLDIKRIEFPHLASPIYKGNHQHLYEKKEADEYIRHYNIRKQLLNTGILDPVDNFKHQLDLLDIDYSSNSLLTKKYWFNYAIGSIKSARCSNASMEYKISKLVKCTEHLAKQTIEKEIFKFSANGINLFLNDIYPTHATQIYLFLKQLDAVLRENQIQAFKFQHIMNPIERFNQDSDKSIYQLSEYKMLLQYVNNIAFHKSKAIDDVKERISKSGNYVNYDSTWLYILMHLNNAWRHSDVLELPRVELKETRIKSLDWLAENDITCEEAHYIINQFLRFDLIISKTRADNYFFCSDDLALSFATAVAICELRLRLEASNREFLMDFETKHGYFPKKSKEAFFLGFSPDFVFKSLKMNRSLMSYVHSILANKNKGGAALHASQRLRGHTGKETTNVYIHIPQEELNFLTHQLFSRKAFGYITDLFTEIILGGADSRILKTKQIIEVQEKFGSIYKIEATAGFLNVITSERQAISDMILHMTIEEVSDYLHKIYTDQLPSREEYYQCLVSETGCVKLGKGISCEDCSYSIPNFYALSILVHNIKQLLDTFQGELEKEELEAERTKLANQLWLKLNLMKQSIKKFGKDEVYRFFDGGREKFMEQMASIESIRSLTTVDKEIRNESK